MFLNVEVSLQRICFKEQILSVELFAYAKFGYRTVSNFNGTKLEKLPNVKLSIVQAFKSQHLNYSVCFVNIEFQFLSKEIKSTTEMNSMEAELEQNESLCLEGCCRLELMKRKMFQNKNFQFSKRRLRKLDRVFKFLLIAP